MPLSPGTRLGVYEVTGILGEGGMGQVYRARDSRLDRDVALKVLPEAWASDPDRLMRFEREAKTLASLNHPNIAAIYGIEERALVMELVEGEDLSTRIARGPIPLDEALPLARQIAEALEAAHEQGIIHRDLKPANIKVRPDGTVKVLDFGLAKALEPGIGSRESGGGDRAAADGGLPTITSPAMTMHGVILGTAAYMSPEQARGKAVDKRADIWAFGCVFYEILTGTRAFDGETLTDVLGAVVRAEPDWTRLPGDTPPAVRRVLTRCLRKDAATRLRDIGDAAIELMEIEPIAVAAAPASPTRAARTSLLTAVAVAAIGVAAAGWMAGRSAAPGATEDTQIRASLALPPDTTFAGAPLSVSPDGNRVVAALLDDKGQVQLWQRSLMATEFRPIANTAGATFAFWSPDSQWIAFASSGQLRRIDVAGDRLETITQLKGRSPGVGAWGADGTILIAADGRLWRVDAAGGEIEPATSLDTGAGERQHLRPSFLGTTRSFIYEAVTLGPLRVVKLASLDDPSSSSVILDNPLVRSTGAAAGHLFFKTGSTLFAQPIDIAGRRLVGTPQRIQEEGLLAAIVPSVSPRVLVHIDGRRASTELQLRDRAGRPLGTVARGGDLTAPDISPSGDRLIYATINPASGRSEIVLTSLADGRTTVVAASDGSLGNPVWSPDGQEVAYMVFEKNASGVYRMRLDSASPPERLIDEEAGVVAASHWTTDGARLIWKRLGGSDTGNDVMMLLLSGDRTSMPLVSTSASENAGTVSPDGRWLAYSSDESGRDEVYLQPFPEMGRRWQVSRAGGRYPRWRADGRELFFQAGNTLTAVEISLGDAPRIGASTALFSFERRPSNVNDYPYAVTPDGQRFVVNALIDEPRLVSIVVNWQATLRVTERKGASQ